MYEKDYRNATCPRRNRPYVQGVDLGSMVFTSGQIPVCPQTGEIPADVQDQARLSLENVKAIVVAAGLSVGDIIKMTVFITDLNDFATINEVYKQFFDEHQATTDPDAVCRLRVAERCEAGN